MPKDRENPINMNNSDPENESSEELENIQEAPEETTETEPTGAGDQPEAIRQLKLELDEYKDRFLRKAAEFENFRKRKQTESALLARSAEESLISQLLPVLDDFDRLFSNAQEDLFQQEAFLRGAQLIYDKLMTLLTARGVQPIQAVGQPFDPQLHEAVTQQPQSGVEPGMVVQEFARGYRIGDRVIRHTKVVVSS